jgi:hypothetical protein
MLRNVTKAETLTVPCSLFPIPYSLVSTVNFTFVRLLISYLQVNIFSQPQLRNEVVMARL